VIQDNRLIEEREDEIRKAQVILGLQNDRFQGADGIETEGADRPPDKRGESDRPQGRLEIEMPLKNLQPRARRG
jgi:hypothetical protein